MMEQKKNIKDYRDSITNKSVEKKENKDLNIIGKGHSQINNEEVETARSKKAEEIETTRSKEPINKLETNSNNTAVVGVVKTLQQKVAEL